MFSFSFSNPMNAVMQKCDSLSHFQATDKWGTVDVLVNNAGHICLKVPPFFSVNLCACVDLYFYLYPSVNPYFYIDPFL